MNSLMTLLLSELVINKQTKGILINLLNLDIDLDLLEEFIIRHPELIELNDIQDKKNKKIKLTISEHFYKMDNLDIIIKTLTPEQLTSIIFQISHTIALIQQKYPGFRHNNLNIDSILR